MGLKSSQACELEVVLSCAWLTCLENCAALPHSSLQIDELMLAKVRKESGEPHGCAWSEAIDCLSGRVPDKGIKERHTEHVSWSAFNHVRHQLPMLGCILRAEPCRSIVICCFA